jgi:hypothetical protein
MGQSDNRLSVTRKQSCARGRSWPLCTVRKSEVGASCVFGGLHAKLAAIELDIVLPVFLKWRPHFRRSQ